MTFVTKLTIQCGDRHLLEDVVSEIARIVERKGAEMKGPHPEPPTTISVPLYRQLESGSTTFPTWEYTIYTRTIDIVGHDNVARLVLERKYPPAIHIEAEVTQVRPMGSRSRSR